MNKVRVTRDNHSGKQTIPVLHILADVAIGRRTNYSSSVEMTREETRFGPSFRRSSTPLFVASSTLTCLPLKPANKLYKRSAAAASRALSCRPPLPEYHNVGGFVALMLSGKRTRILISDFSRYGHTMS